MKVRQIKSGYNTSSAITLLQRFFRDEGFDTPAALIAQNTKTMATLESCALFVVEMDGQDIGVATISSEFGIELGWWAEMGDLYVLPEWRSKGVADALVDAIEQWLRQRNIMGYQVTVTPIGEDHHGLMSYYSKLGFGTEGRLLLSKEVR